MARTVVTVADQLTVAVPTEALTTPVFARLAVDLLDLDRQIKDGDAQLTERLGDHPQADNITSTPGLGSFLRAHLLADTNGDFRAYRGHPGQLAAHGGLAPDPVKDNLYRRKRYHRPSSATTAPSSPSRRSLRLDMVNETPVEVGLALDVSGKPTLARVDLALLLHHREPHAVNVLARLPGMRRFSEQWSVGLPYAPGSRKITPNLTFTQISIAFKI